MDKSYGLAGVSTDQSTRRADVPRGSSEGHAAGIEAATPLALAHRQRHSVTGDAGDGQFTSPTGRAGASPEMPRSDTSSPYAYVPTAHYLKGSPRSWFTIRSCRLMSSSGIGIVLCGGYSGVDELEAAV